MHEIEVKKSVAVCGGYIRGTPANFAERPGIGVSRSIFLGVSEASLGKRLEAEIKAFAPGSPIVLASRLAQLRELATNSDPEIIFLDSALLGDKDLSGEVQKLAAVAPVIVLASIDSQAEVSRPVAGGSAEFIGRAGNYVALAAALIERRLNQVRISRGADAAEPQLPIKLGELFRHEINNPLTGILGNVELVLAHKEHLSPVEVQRLQTVIDLAVRLRESIRQISSACEGSLSAANSV